MANSSSSVFANSRAVKMCCTVVMGVTTCKSVLLLLNAGFNARINWFMSAVASGMASDPAVAATTTVVYSFLD